MPTHVAFLRGMNLGKRRISNAGLVAVFEDLGFSSVATYRASGNVIFEAPRQAEALLIAGIETGLQDALGYAVPTFLRSATKVRGIAAFDPFDLNLVAASDGKLQVSLLTSAPVARERARALALATDDDLLSIAGRELYWLPSGGMRDSDLDLGAIERLLGAATMRTKGTIEGIAAKLPDAVDAIHAR